MKIATAAYDANGTLVTPDEVIPPVFEIDELTTEAGFWHRYQMSFSSKAMREQALETIQEQLRDFDARPYDISMDTVYPGKNPAYIAAMREAGNTPPPPDKPFHVLEVIYVIETPEHTPYYRMPKGTPIDEHFTMPIDPVVDEFVATYNTEPLDLPAQQEARNALREAAARQAQRVMQPSTIDNFVEARESNRRLQREKDDIHARNMSSARKRRTFTYAQDPHNDPNDAKDAQDNATQPQPQTKAQPAEVEMRKIGALPQGKSSMSERVARVSTPPNDHPQRVAERPVFDITF